EKEDQELPRSNPARHGSSVPPVAKLNHEPGGKPPRDKKRGRTNLALLELRDLHVSHQESGTEIVKGVDLKIDQGEIHAVMGPNGSGKSTLAYALMGHPAYEITGGEVVFDGADLLAMGPDERAQRGLFLAFQYPHAIP